MWPSPVTAISASWILRALLRGGEEMFGAVLDPFNGPLESDCHPGQQHLLGIEHHDLGAEAAADERSHHPHLTRSDSFSMAARPLRTTTGAWVVSHTVSRSALASQSATTPRVSIGGAAAVVAEAATQNQRGGLSGGIVIA